METLITIISKVAYSIMGIGTIGFIGGSIYGIVEIVKIILP